MGGPMESYRDYKGAIGIATFSGFRALPNPYGGVYGVLFFVKNP